MGNLADLADVETLIGRTIDEPAEKTRVETLLELASSRFRREARQRFTEGESLVRLKVVDLVVFLPESPVIEVIAVTGDDGQPLAWRALSPNGQEISLEVGGELVLRPGLVVESPGSEARRPGFVVVHYRHGGDVPAPVRLSVADAVRRALTVDKDAATGSTQVTETHSRGPFSRTSHRQFASWAVGGQVLLSPDDLALARSYRPRPPRLWAMRP